MALYIAPCTNDISLEIFHGGHYHKFTGMRPIMFRSRIKHPYRGMNQTKRERERENERERESKRERERVGPRCTLSILWPQGIVTRVKLNIWVYRKQEGYDMKRNNDVYYKLFCL